MAKKTTSLSDLKSMLGIGSLPINSKVNLDIGTRLNRYSEIEKSNLVHAQYTNRSIGVSQNGLNKDNLISYISPIHEKIGNKKINASMMRSLTPEINKAATLLPAIIMSPNDLQDGEIHFSIKLEDNVLPAAICEKISDYLFDYFNNDLELAVKETMWLDEIIFTDGAKPILILPNNLFKKMVNDSIHNTDTSAPAGKRSFFENFGTDYLLSENVNFDNMFMSNETISFENFNISRTREGMSVIDNNRLFISLAEEFKLQYALENQHVSEIDNVTSKFDETKFISGCENATIKLITQLNDGDFVKITDNPTIVRAGYDVIKKTASKYEDEYDNIFKNTYKAYKPAHVDTIPEESDDGDVSGHPIFIELPVESVIPITVPGSKKNHLGYFLLLDEFGYPLEVDKEIMNGNCCTPGSVAGAYQAMFGDSSNCFGTCGLKGNPGHLASARIFESLLDEYLKKKMNNINHGTIEVNKMNSISTCLFYRLLYNKKTMILYIPEHLLTYYAFRYREDGTGKNILEDVEFILSLKITFMVASILSMMNDAVPHTRFNVTFPTDEANPEQIVDQIKNIYLENNQLQFSSNPSDIAKAIYSRSITVAPTNFPGAENFSIEKTSDDQNSKIDINTDLLDKLDNSLIDSLIIPHSILNQLGEAEFAKSVVTNNLILSKQAANFQRILNKHNNKITRLYTRYSSKLRAGIKKILSDNGRSTTIRDGSIGIDALLLKVIDSIHTSLPSPNIAADKTKYTEINDFVAALESILSNLYNSEMISKSDHEASEAQQLIRAYLKASVTREFMNKIGVTSLINIPELKDMPITDMIDYQQLSANLIAGVKRKLDSITPKEEDSVGSSDDFQSDDDGDDFSMDDNNMSFDEEESELPEIQKPEEESDSESTATDDSPTDNDESSIETEDDPAQPKEE